MEADGLLLLKKHFGGGRGKEIQQKRNENMKNIIKNDTNNIHKECDLRIHNLYNINKGLVNQIKELQLQVDDLLEYKKNHVCVFNPEDIEHELYDRIYKDVKKDIISEINVKETQEYIEISKINKKNDEKIKKMESDIKNMKLNSNIEDNELFKQLKEQNAILSESNKNLQNNYDLLKKDNNKIYKKLFDLENKKEDILQTPVISKKDIKETLEKNTEHKINNVIDKIKNNNNLIKDEEDRLKLINENRCKIDTLAFLYEKYGEDKNDNFKLLSISYDKNHSRFKKMTKIYYMIKNNKNLYNSNLIFQYHTFDTINIKDDLISLINKMTINLIK